MEKKYLAGAMIIVVTAGSLCFHQVQWGRNEEIPETPYRVPGYSLKPIITMVTTSSTGWAS